MFLMFFINFVFNTYKIKSILEPLEILDLTLVLSQESQQRHLLY